jgi:maltose phosphorylase
MWIRKNGFSYCTGMRYNLLKNNIPVAENPKVKNELKFVANEYSCAVTKGDTVQHYKYAVNLSPLDHAAEALAYKVRLHLEEASDTGFERLLAEHREAWQAIWDESNIVIEGDRLAQQAIRFNIFQLNQTCTGEDERLNIHVLPDRVEINNNSPADFSVAVSGTEYSVEKGNKVQIDKSN